MAKKLKIAFLSRFQDRVDRGVETYVEELSKRLSQKHEVKILKGSDADSFLKIINGKYDVVIPTNGRLQALKASVGRIFKGYKTIIPGQAGIGRDDIWNIAVTAPQVYVALTDFEEKWAKQWAWRTKVVKIPNGVDLDRFHPARSHLARLKPVILSAGALTWYKHHERTINAMQYVDGVLIIVGEGDKKQELLKLGNEKIPGRLKIISADYNGMPKIYRSADLFVLPSWDRESFGIVYLEAMASGLPVVAPDDPPKREIMGNAGILVDTDDPEVYANAINEALQRNWKDFPRKQAEKFSWDKVAEKYEQLLEEMFK